MISCNVMSLFQKTFVNFALNWNELLKLRVSITKSVEQFSNWYIGEDMNGKQQGKFSSADGHRQKYTQNSKEGIFLAHLVVICSHTHMQHNRFTTLLEFVRDHPGEQVPSER